MNRHCAVAILLLCCLLPRSVSGAQASDGSSFSIEPSFRYADIYDLYEDLDGSPLFVTTDLVLHTAHLLFDYSLRAVEIEKLYPLARELSEAMAGVAERSLAGRPPTGVPSEVEEAQREVLGYFCVAAKLLNPDFKVPRVVRAEVEKDLELIAEAEGFEFSATLPHGEDFSQYVPRGHYTHNEKLERYFKAMMWYGRRIFRVESTRWDDGLPPPCMPDRWSDEIMLREARGMILIARLLAGSRLQGRPASEVWESLYRPTVLFAGRTEDLNVSQVASLAREVWGGLPGGGEPGDEGKVREFIRLAREATRPRVDSTGAGRKGFCFMGQRFTPDAYIFQCLVTDTDDPFGRVPPHPLPYTGDRRPRPFTWVRTPLGRECRGFPRGLDVLAVFGSEQALSILEGQGDTDYEGYARMLAYLRDDIGTMMAERRSENLYYGWLWSLMPLLEVPSGRTVPGFIQGKAWTRKQLATALASWAELRHDTILYVKQSYTPTERAMPPVARAGYVEPYPETYRRIANMVQKMRTELGALGVMPEGLERNYRMFEETVRELERTSRRQLAGESLPETEHQRIRRAPARLRAATQLPARLREEILSETDSRMALIADVHTDNNTRQVLEEGVGHPFLLTVRMDVNGRPVTLKGGVFSYYEFKHPMEERLTDEAWQKMLGDEGSRPAMPGWLASALAD